MLAAVIRYARSAVRSIEQVRAYAARHGLSGRQAEAAVERCRALGLLDDSAAARLWAAQWSRQGWARAAVRIKLAEKGFSQPVIREAVETVEDDLAQARRLVEESRQPAERMARRLAARGFDPELIDQALHASRSGR